MRQLSTGSLSQIRWHILHRTLIVHALRRRFVNTMAAECTVSALGATFSCTRAGMNVVLLDETSAASLPAVILVRGELQPRLVLVLLCSFCEHDGRVTRVSPALLGLLLRCYAALRMPELTALRALNKSVCDPALRASCRGSMCRTVVNAKGLTTGCHSQYHTGCTNVPLDPRSRSKRCAACFTLEQDLRQAAWPTVESLAHRLAAPAAAAVTTALLQLSRNRLLALLGRTAHDLDLAGINFDNCRPWLHQATPHAAALLAIARSKHSGVLAAVARTVTRRGWTVRPVLAKSLRIGNSIFASGPHYILTEWQNAAAALLGREVVLTLTAPGQSVAGSLGPVETWACQTLIEHLLNGRTRFFGCRATGSAAALELLVDAAAVTTAVTIAPIGPEHCYHGSNSTVRAWLAKEAAGVDAAVPAGIEAWLCGRSSDNGDRAAKKRRTADAPEDADGLQPEASGAGAG